MKQIGTCNHCLAPQVVRDGYANPNGKRNCGICGKGELKCKDATADIPQTTCKDI